MANGKNLGLWYWNIVWATLFISVVMYGQLLYFDGLTEESNRQAIRWSARLAVLLFSLAFSAGAVHLFWKNTFTFWLRMNRKHLGISFALSHLIHLGWLLILQQNFHPVFDRAKTISLIGGGLAYVFLVLMLLTSFPYFANKISGRQWKILHTVGGWWIWYIFARSYVKRAQTESEYIPIVVLLTFVLIIRLAARWQKRRTALN